jgi:hypothetical protein
MPPTIKLMSKGSSSDRRVPLEANDPAVFGFARECFNTCLDSHPTCARLLESMVLPTRLLKVEKSNTSDKIRLVPRYLINGFRPTCALSYRWGLDSQSSSSSEPSKALQTNEENLKRHEEGIVLEQLPKTIRDAVNVAWELKIPYLWVDRLCITQDNEDDKKQEIYMMKQTYRNAVVTLCASSSTDSDEGLFVDREAISSAFSGWLKDRSLWEYSRLRPDRPRLCRIRLNFHAFLLFSVLFQ